MEPFYFPDKKAHSKRWKKPRAWWLRMWTLVPDCLRSRRLPPQPHCAALETYFTSLCLCFCVYKIVVIIPTLQGFCENELMHTCPWRTILPQFHSFSEEGISLNTPAYDFGGDRAVQPRSFLSLYPGNCCPQDNQLPLYSIHLKWSLIWKIPQSTSVADSWMQNTFPRLSMWKAAVATLSDNGFISREGDIWIAIQPVLFPLAFGSDSGKKTPT